MPRLTVEQIAARVGGTVRGDAGRPILGVAALPKAGSDDLTFVAGEKQLRGLTSLKAGACLISQRDAADAETLAANTSLIVVADPHEAFVTVLREFRPQRPRPQIGVSSQAFVSPAATLGTDCNIYPGAYIAAGVVLGARCDIYPGAYIGEDCRLGNDCVLHPHAVLYPDVTLGDRVIVHASAVLGADGFGYRLREGRHQKVPQLGSVTIHDDVEIGACTTIDRGMIGATIVGEGSKIDNLVMIGHNCELGRHNVLVSQVGFAGSVTTGDYVVCAGQVGIADHVHLGANSQYGAKAGVHKDMPAGGTYVGIPATDEGEAKRAVMSLFKVPELRKQVREVEQQLAKLTEQMGQILNERRAA